MCVLLCVHDTRYRNYCKICCLPLLMRIIFTVQQYNSNLNEIKLLFWLLLFQFIWYRPIAHQKISLGCHCWHFGGGARSRKFSHDCFIGCELSCTLIGLYAKRAGVLAGFIKTQCKKSSLKEEKHDTVIHNWSNTYTNVFIWYNCWTTKKKYSKVFIDRIK